METKYQEFKARGFEVLTILTEGVKRESPPTLEDLQAWSAHGATYPIVADPMWTEANKLWEYPSPGWDKLLRPGVKVVSDYPADLESIEKYLPN